MSEDGPRRRQRNHKTRDERRDDTQTTSVSEKQDDAPRSVSDQPTPPWNAKAAKAAKKSGHFARPGLSGTRGAGRAPHETSVAGRRARNAASPCGVILVSLT